MKQILLIAILAVALPGTAFADVLSDLVKDAKQAAADATSEITESIGSSASGGLEQTGETSAIAEPPAAPAAKSTKIRNADIDGARLGMPFNEAIKNLEMSGYRLTSSSECLQKPVDSSNPCYEEGPGVHVELYKGDGRATNVKVYLWQLDGTVYRITRNALYTGKTDRTLDSVIREFDDRYGGGYKVGGAGSRTSALFEYDDETPPPYSRDIKTPHAKVAVSGGRGSLRIIERLIWQDAVGASGLWATE